MSGDASGDQTPWGTAHATVLASLSWSTLTTPAGGSPPLECDSQNTSVKINPRASTQAHPPTTSMPQSGPVPPPEGSEGEAKAPEGSPGCQTSESKSRQGRPSPCPPCQPGPGRVRSVCLRIRRGTGRCWSTRSGHPRAWICSIAMVTHLGNLENQSPATAGRP